MTEMEVDHTNFETSEVRLFGTGTLDKWDPEPLTLETIVIKWRAA